MDHHSATCPNCKAPHAITWSAHFGYVDCPVSGKTYMAGVNGLKMPGPIGTWEEDERKARRRLLAEHGMVG